MAEFHLVESIIDLSVAKDWEHARAEWQTDRIFFIEGADTCLCTHHPIKEICEISNTLNGNKAIVGNCCINKVMDSDYSLIFRTLAKIHKDETKAIDEDTAFYLHQNKIINDYEADFCFDTEKRQYRTLRNKQKLFRMKINESVLKKMCKGQHVDRFGFPISAWNGIKRPEGITDLMFREILAKVLRKESLLGCQNSEEKVKFWFKIQKINMQNKLFIRLFDF